MAAGSLEELTKSLDITAHDAHSSIGDTSVTTEALLRLVDRLHDGDPDFRVEPFLVPFDPTMRVARGGGRGGRAQEEAPLTEEHAAAHELDLTHKARRERALRICIAEHCVHPGTAASGPGRAVCVDALALRAGSKARVYDRLDERLARIKLRKANKPKPPPRSTRNARKPRTSPLRAT